MRELTLNGFNASAAELHSVALIENGSVVMTVSNPRKKRETNGMPSL
jgi:hypothetical protein